MNSVNPTGVLTAMGKKGFAASPEKQALLVNRIPIGRIAGINLACLHVLYCSIYWSDTSQYTNGSSFWFEFGIVN